MLQPVPRRTPLTVVETSEPQAASEQLIPPERVHGKFERIELPSSTFIKMSQVRGGRNPISDELKASIAEFGMLNSIDCAHLDAETLAEYIDFTNYIWQAKATLEDFTDKQQPDGSFYLVVAGHTRHQAITELEEEGQMPVYPIEAKVHHIETPQQIIDIQLAENIHGQPRNERRAMAIVEAYEWGKSQGRWSNQKEYLEQNKGVSKSVLSEALAFVNIPMDIRKFVYGGKLSYSTGLEVGKAAADLKKYRYFKIGLNEDEADETEQQAIKKLMDIDLVIQVNKILNAHASGVKAAKMLQAWREQMKREMMSDQAQREDAEQVAMFDLDMKSPNEILQEELAAARGELRSYLAEYGHRPTSAAQDLIDLHRGILPDELIDEFLSDNARAAAQAARLVGSASVGRTVTPPTT